jgi:hypothetical protein
MTNLFIEDNNGNPVKLNWYQNAVIIWSETYEDGNLSKFQLNEDGTIMSIDYSCL